MCKQNIQFTKGQQNAFDQMMKFVESQDSKVYILRGYAGTGKTTLVKSLVKKLDEKGFEHVLLASTGRAAKILSNATCCGASTIHSLIYKFTDLSQDLSLLVDENVEMHDDGQLYLNFDLVPVSGVNKIYIIDESSMISDEKDKKDFQAQFGSGRLLSDLFEYDPNGKFIFIGDACQLPPTSHRESPALSAQYLKKVFDIDAMETELTEVVRQSNDNDIVQAAHCVRKLYMNPQPWRWAKFPFKGYKNIHVLNSSAELYSKYLEAVADRNFNDATLISYSNKQCEAVTDIIRPALNIHDKTISEGDLLLITQNNYPTGLMNGDQVVVKKIVNRTYRAGMSFVDVEVEELFSKRVYNQLLLEDILYTNQTNLNAEQHKELYKDFYVRMSKKGIKQKSPLFNDLMLGDPFINAIKAVFGYSLTCHKSQGGEWQKVFLDIPRYLPALEKPYVYQWIYTAMTRARQELYVVKDFWLM